MRRILALCLAMMLFLSACGGGSAVKSANEVAALVLENEALFLACAEEIEAFGEDRLYVAMEAKESEEGEELTEEEKKPRLVSYPKESDDRTEIENETLEKALTQFGFKLIFFQTASDSRRCVIFSYTKENDNVGIQNGFYYSPDGLPCAWWGRRSDLTRDGDRYLQFNNNESAWYYTTQIKENFYYFEKHGDLVA